MVKTNLDLEFRKILYQEHLTRKNVCEVFEITPSSLSRLLHKEMPTPQLVSILDTLGYDLEINFVKRERRELIFERTE